METTDRIDVEIAVRQALSPRVVRDVSRIEGQKPFALIQQGGRSFLRQVTATLAPDGFDVIYLTNNGQARGDGVFRGMPRVSVMRDEDNSMGGLVRANGPSSIGKPLRLCPHTAFRLEWNPSDNVWSVMVANDTENVTSFLVESEGV